jgi:hypothetical protein
MRTPIMERAGPDPCVVVGAEGCVEVGLDVVMAPA